MKHIKITPGWLTQPRRRLAYRLGAAVAALLVGYGLLNGEEALLWLAIVAALLGIAQDNT